MEYRIFYESKGLGTARQIVVDNARGKYIIWLDGDVVLSKSYVRELIQLMEKNPRVGIAKGRYALDPGANLAATLEIYSRAAGKMIDFNIKTSCMGTAGCIYRTEAIRKVGGFDQNIKGYGEDWDAERRIKNAGWLLRTIDASYRDYERKGTSWKNIWNKYLRRGYDSYYTFQKHKGLIVLYRWTPPAALLSGYLHSLTLYRLTRRKAVFLLPLQYSYKMTAWCLGFSKRRLVTH